MNSVRPIDANELLCRYPECRELKRKVDAMPTVRMSETEIVIAARVMESMENEVDAVCEDREYCEGCKYYGTNKRCMMSTNTFRDTMESFKRIHGTEWQKALQALIETAVVDAP